MIADRPRQSALPAGALLIALLTTACSSAGSGRATAPSVPAGEREKQEQGLPIGIGVGAAPSQRTFTFRYDGPGGNGVLSLTLRLERADRFLLTGRDRILRRQVWALAVDGSRGLLIDPRAETYCWYGGEVELAAVPLGPLPLTTLPALLLGRVPLPPAEQTQRIDDGRLEFRDARGRVWQVRTLDGVVETWTLLADGEPEVWYSTRGEMRYLSARREGLQLRWRENLSEPLSGTLPAPAPPDGFRLDCPD